MNRVLIVLPALFMVPLIVATAVAQSDGNDYIGRQKAL